VPRCKSPGIYETQVELDTHSLLRHSRDDEARDIDRATGKKTRIKAMYKQCVRKKPRECYPGVGSALHLGPQQPTTVRPEKKGEKGEAQRAAHEKAPASGESRKYVCYRVN